MDFKRARNNEQIANRQEEIINACYSLFSKGNYNDITFGKISEITSISRPSIYNYYITPEEILLDVLEREYFKWYEYIKSNYNEGLRLNKKDLTNLFINSFDNSSIFLKLLNIQFSIIERNCSFEKLTQFEMNTQCIFKFVESIVAKTFPRSTTSSRYTFVLMLLSSVGSFYEMCNPNETKIKTMKITNRNYTLPNFKDLYKKYIETLISNL